MSCNERFTVRRLGSVRIFRVRQHFFATSTPSQRRSIGIDIDIQGWPGNGGEADRRGFGAGVLGNLNEMSSSRNLANQLVAITKYYYSL